MSDSTRSSLLRYGQVHHPVDLGNDPPLYMSDETEAEAGPVLRSVSWRWLTGTVLTGVTSIVLMGAALMAALSNPNQIAELPDSLTAQAASADDPAFGSKGDRLRPGQDRFASRQILQVSTVIRQDERDFIKLRPYARIQATLSPRLGELAALIPEYDIRRIFADTSEPETPDAGPEPVVAGSDDQLYGANVDGEVAVKVSPFPVAAADLEPSVALTTTEVNQIVLGDAMLADGFTGPRRNTALAYAEASPFDSLDGDVDVGEDVRIVPENLSSIAKSDGDEAGGMREDVSVLSDFDSLAEALAHHQVGEEDAAQIMSALSRLVDVEQLAVGHDDRIRIAQVEAKQASGGRETMRVSIYRNGAHQATVAQADNGIFVRADKPSSDLAFAADVERPAEPQAGAVANLYNAIYETALKQHIPDELIDQLVRIFAFDVDFQARVAAGDTLEVFHSIPEDGDLAVVEPEILYAALTHAGQTKRFYRFRTSDDAIVDYYDSEGKSAKKFLMRKPMTEGVLRSRFGMRRHPIHKVRRMHQGVDYAARRGTPILAAGNGTVVRANRNSGYGNVTILRHTNGYETLYAHQTKFANGIKKGAKVRQGQVIGYVGSTGLSTGPHLHYEIRVNGKAVDPLRIRLPRGRVLQDEFLTAFEVERQRIDELLGIEEAPTQLASNN